MTATDSYTSSGLLAVICAAACSPAAVDEHSANVTSKHGAIARSDAGAGAGEAPDARGPRTPSDGCPANTGFAGDERCLAPPAAEAGFQLHYGPSDYASALELSPFVLAEGSEIVDCFYEKTPNTSDVYVSGYQFQMRPGSHHLLVNVNPEPQEDGFGECLINDMNAGLLGGTQTPKVDERADPAPENEGLAVRLPARSQAVINFHVIDAGAEPILREAWLNYFYMNESDVKGLRGNVFLTGGLGYHIEPGTQQTYRYSCSPERPVRILSLAAHMHAHATRLSAWKVSAQHPTLVYEAFDWAEPLSLKYDSVHDNTDPDRATLTPGGSSGALTIEPGEALQWECAIDNTSADVLTFRNEVYTGEMCILVGVEVPTDEPMRPYDFTCLRQ